MYKTNIDIFVQFAVNVMGVDINLRDNDKIVKEGIKRLRAFFKDMGLPTTLGELDIDDTNLG